MKKLILIPIILLLTLSSVNAIIECGFQMTTSETLTRDLDCRGPPAFSGTSSYEVYINADGITLDCAGYTIIGDSSTSIILVNGKRGVTIKNCNVRVDGTNSIVGYYISNSESTRIIDSNAHWSTYPLSTAIRIWGGNSNTVEGGYFTGNSGVSFSNTFKNLIKDTEIQCMNGNSGTIISFGNAADSNTLQGNLLGFCGNAFYFSSLVAGNKIYNNKIQATNTLTSITVPPNNDFDNGFLDCNNLEIPTNIIGGNCVGGNYWYSWYTGIDSDGDGIGDTAFTYDGIIDNYPLVICTPSCVGKECGDDGCGGSCGTCTSPQVCSAGSCVVSTEVCTGGIDEDGDGLKDCLDDDCDLDPVCQCIDTGDDWYIKDYVQIAGNPTKYYDECDTHQPDSVLEKKCNFGQWISVSSSIYDCGEFGCLDGACLTETLPPTDCSTINCADYDGTDEATCIVGDCCSWDAIEQLCTPGPEALYCNPNDALHTLEECDPITPIFRTGQDTCQDFGYVGGTLGCTTHCKLDTTQCTTGIQCETIPDCSAYTSEQCELDECGVSSGYGCYMLDTTCSVCDPSFCSDYRTIDNCEMNPCRSSIGLECMWDITNGICKEDNTITIGGQVWDCEGQEWGECVEGTRSTSGACTGEGVEPQVLTVSCRVTKEFPFFSANGIIIVLVLLIGYYVFTDYYKKHKKKK